MSYKLNTARSVLGKALPEVQDLLTEFVSDSDFNSQLDLSFRLSTSRQSDRSKDILNRWLADDLPAIEIVSGSSINGAWGAYAGENNTVYLAQEFLNQNQNNPDAVRNVLLEELGHALSHQIDPEDAPGDEGAIFSSLVRDEAIAPETLAQLQSENDTVTVTLGDRELQIEQAEAGVNPAFDLIGLTALRNDPNFAEIDGTGFDVVVIDSGLDRTHPLLDDNYRAGFDYIENDSDPNDLVDHGTHVAGTIGAEDENIGVAPDVGLIGLKIGDREGLNNLAINEALQRVLDDVNNPNSEFNVVAINLSLGGGFYTAPNQPNSIIDNESRRIIQDLEAAGVTVVAAAGNDYIGKSDFEGNLFDEAGNLLDPNQVPNTGAPAIYSTLAVGAVWQNNIDFGNTYSQLQTPGEDRLAVFSQRLGSDNFLLAPGTDINSTVPVKFDGDLSERIKGTSQASPHVAGAVALLQEIAAGYNVRLSPEQVRDYLIDNAEIVVDGDDEEDVVTNTGLSYPRINIHQSAIALRNDLENNAVANNPVEPETNPVSNDVIAEAIDVTLGNDRQPLVFDGVLGQDFGVPVTQADVDLYRITIPDNGSLQIDIDTPYANFPDSYLRLFDENGEELFYTTNNRLVASDNDLAPGEVLTTNLDPTGTAIVTNDSSGAELINGVRNENGYQPGNYGHSTDSFLEFSAQRGETYYIGVSDFTNQQYNPISLENRPAPSEDGQYELIATFINDDINGSITQVTTNIALPTAGFRASVGNDAETAVGEKDVDFYRVNSPTAGILEIDINSITDTSITDAESVDSVVVLFDEQGNLLGFNDDTDTTDSLLRFQVEANTNYYAGVTGFGNQDFDPLAVGSGSGGDTGEYILNSRLLPSSAAFSISDNVIDADLVTNVALGDTISGRIGEDNGYIIGATDVDLYRFVPETDGTVSIRVNASQEFDADTFLRFFGANGNEIAVNDDENPSTRGSFLEVEVQAGATYYIGVNGFSEGAGSYNPLNGTDAAPGSQGDYTLSVGDFTGSNQPIIDDSPFAVYRFFRPEVGVHFYTSNPTERDAILTDLPNFNFEGVSYQSVDPLSGSPAVTPVYRLLNRDTGVHLYTVSETERDTVAQLPNFTLEGEAFYGYEEPVEGSIPIHRFYNPGIGAHFYTPSETEREAVETGLPDYQYEGVAYYALPSE